MTSATHNHPFSHWRKLRWGAASLLLLLPWLAMRFTDEVVWDTADFAVFGALLVGVCGGYDLAMRMRDDFAYRAAVAVALAAAFLLVWLSLGVGLIGQDGDPANGMYFGVLAVGFIGAVIARLQPLGMARALLATALAQAVVTAIALGAGLGQPWSGPAELLLLNGFFVALFVAAAWLFGRAARAHP
jgi:hypothetical protein